MENYEEILDKSLPRRDGMSVPDGYFDSLCSRVMARIDREEAPRPTLRLSRASGGVLRSYVATAACVAIIALGVFTLLLERGVSSKPQASDVAVVSQSSIDQVADYMMLDNGDIYSILSE